MQQNELKEFVTQSLTNIMQGVSDAQELTKNTRAIVNPKVESPATPGGALYKGGSSIGGYLVQMIDFDVIVEAGYNKDNVGIKFSVPVVFPYQK